MSQPQLLTPTQGVRSLEKHIRGAARSDHNALIDAEFAPALARAAAANDSESHKALRDTRNKLKRIGARAAEEAALAAFLFERAPDIITPAKALILNPADLPRRALNASGAVVEPGNAEHVITHFYTAGLMFDVRTPRRVNSQQAARDAAAECDLLGRKGEWVLGEDYELQLIVDRAFHAPAVNQKSFPNMPKEGWVYTNRNAAWSAGRAWFLNLGYGYVYWYLDGAGGLVVPVLRVPASQ